MVENNILFLNLEVKMECFVSFSHTFDDKKNYIHLHKPDHIRTSPNTIFSDTMWQNKAQSSKDCLQMLSDQKQQKDSGHHGLILSFID